MHLALIREQAGDAAGALEALERAMRLGEPAGYVRVFVDAGEPLPALLRQLLRGGVRPAFVGRLLPAFGTGAPQAARTPELLMPREHEVLRLLARVCRTTPSPSAW